MFSSVGWGEVLIIVIVGIIVVGPERLPRMINDVKALLLAARRTIANARKEFDDDFGEDFEEFRKPLEQLNSVRQMGARGFITKTLLDDDDSFLTDFEDSANEVKGAAQGTANALRHPVTSLRSEITRPVPADGDIGAADTSADTAAESEGEKVEPRVELPQQDEVGQSRDWSNTTDYDDAV